MVSGRQRDAEPVALEVRVADELDLAAGDEPLQVVRPQQLRLPGSQHVGRGSARVPDAERLPHVRVRNVVVELVDVVRPADALALLVVERDEEVRRVHQLADDRVHRTVKSGEIARGGRCFGNAVKDPPDPAISGVDRFSHDVVPPRVPPSGAARRRARAGP